MTETLLISSGNGPGECRLAVAHLLAYLAEAAEALDLGLDVAEREAPHGPSSAIVRVSGAVAEGFAARWEGVVLWRCHSPLRSTHRRKNWFVQVFRLQAVSARVQIDERSVTFQAIRAGGPGGQHVNKTSSAIRAAWVGPGGQSYTVVVRDSRSQHMNRKAALERLAGLVAADQAEAEAAQRGANRHLHHQLVRGAPKHIFDGPDFCPARSRTVGPGRSDPVQAAPKARNFSATAG
jgi:peptide chain release factor